MRQTLTIQKAVAVAAEFGDADFTAAVEDAQRVGLQSVEVVTVDEGGKSDIYLLRPKGLMLAWKPEEWDRKRIAVQGGTPRDEIHMTLVYLGDVEDFDEAQQRTIVGVATEVAQKHKAIIGRVNGIGRFLDSNEDNETPVWLGGDFPGLRELRDDLVAALRHAGIEWEETYPDFQPHITIGYIDAEADMPPMTITPFVACVDNVTMYIGGLEYKIDLDGPIADPYYEDVFPDDDASPNLYVPVLKAAQAPVKDEVKKYTYGPWYVPEQVDLHGEWATRDDVQTALWKYVDSGDREIRLQHNTEIVAGRWVELATMPFPVSVPMMDERGQMVKYTYPAGTPFMGVIWEDWAWPLVETDVIKGYSIGGSARRMYVDLPEAAATAAHDAAVSS